MTRTRLKDPQRDAQGQPVAKGVEMRTTAARDGMRGQPVAGTFNLVVKCGAPLDHPDHNPDDLAEEERLGHGRGLQVKQIGIEGEEDERERGGRGVEPVPRQAIDAGAGGDVGGRRGNDAGKTVGPPGVVLHEGNEENVRQRQPHGAEFGKAGGARVEDAARDVKMGDGIAVVEHRGVIPAPNDGGERGCHGEGQDRPAFGVGDAAISQGA